MKAVSSGISKFISKSCSFSTRVRNRHLYRLKDPSTTAIQCTVGNALDCDTLVQWSRMETLQKILSFYTFRNLLLADVHMNITILNKPIRNHTLVFELILKIPKLKRSSSKAASKAKKQKRMERLRAAERRQQDLGDTSDRNHDAAREQIIDNDRFARVYHREIDYDRSEQQA